MKNKIGPGGLLVAAAGCFWGTTGIFSHLFGAYGLTALMMSFLRALAAVLLITPLMLKKGGSSFFLSKRGWLIAIIQGITTQTIFSFTYFSAITHLGMSSAVILLYTSPIYVTILSRILFGERVTGKKVIALIVTFIGCALTATGGVFDLSGLSTYGLLMGLISGFMYGMLSITGRYITEEDDPVSITYFTIVIGLIGLTILARPWNCTGIVVDLKFVIIVLTCGLFSSVLPYMLFSFGISKLKEASMAPILASVENIAATLFGYFIFHEAVGIYRVAGIALVLMSIVIINMSNDGKHKG